MRPTSYQMFNSFPLESLCPKVSIDIWVGFFLYGEGYMSRLFSTLGPNMFRHYKYFKYLPKKLMNKVEQKLEKVL